MLPGAATPVAHPLWIGPITTVRSEHDGIFYPLAAPEAYVQQGMRIGYVTDYFGNKLADLTSPVSGVIAYICSVPSMKKHCPIGDRGDRSRCALTWAVVAA